MSSGNTSPRGSRPRARSSSVEAAAVRRLAAHRSTSAATTVREPEPPAGELPAEQTAANERSPLGRLFAPVCLAVVTLVLGAFAAFFAAQASGLTATASAQNRALTDTAETSQVTAQVKSAVGALFSYNYENPAPTDNAARTLLTGSAVHQYAVLFAQVHKDAAAKKLVVSSAVTDAGVELLTAGTGRVLVFLSETDTTGTAAPVKVGAMLAVNVIRSGATWKISGIDTFSR